MPTARQRPSIDSILDPERVRILREVEALIKEYITEKERHRGRLLPGSLALYVERLKELTGRSSPQTLLNLANRYVDYLINHPQEPAINALINVPGRPAKTSWDPKIEDFILAAYMRRKRKSRLSTGKEKIIVTRPEVEEVFKLVIKTFPGYNITKNILYHFLRKARNDNRMFVEYTRTDDEDQVFTRRLGKKKNDVEFVNERWQLDGRPLPNLLRGDGFTFTVTILPVMDDKSEFVLAFDLIPRKKKDADGNIVDTDFTNEDVRIVLATAMLTHGRRTRIIYSDKGPQVEAIRVYLKLLTDDNLEPPIRLITTRKRSPSGKGKMEKVQHLVDYIAPQLPGNTEDTDNPFPKQLTKKDIEELCDFEEFFTEVDEWIKRWNQMPVGGYPSRQAMWEAETAMHLPAPSPFRLGLFGKIQSLKEDALVYPRGILYEKEYWQNPWKTPEDYERFTNAAGKRVFICKIVFQRKIRVFARLGPELEEVVPSDENQKISATKYNGFQAYVRKKQSQKRQEKERVFDEVLRERFGEIPVVGVQDREALLSHEGPQQPVILQETTSDPGEKSEAPKPRSPRKKEAAAAATIAAAAASQSTPSTMKDELPHQQDEVVQPLPNFVSRLRQLRASREGNDEA